MMDLHWGLKKSHFKMSGQYGKSAYVSITKLSTKVAGFSMLSPTKLSTFPEPRMRRANNLFSTPVTSGSTRDSLSKNFRGNYKQKAQTLIFYLPFNPSRHASLFQSTKGHFQYQLFRSIWRRRECLSNNFGSFSISEMVFI